MFIGHVSQFDKNTAYAVNADEIMISTNAGLVIANNKCPHMGMRLLDDSECARDVIVCPYHGWAWDLTGVPVSSGTCSVQNKCVIDTSRKAYNSGGFLFTKSVDLQHDLTFDTNLLLEHTRVDIVNNTALAVLDVFLDVDHIHHAHAHVYDQIGLDDQSEVEWKFYKWGSVQLAKTNNNICAAWFAVYPYTMLEWQGGCWYITQCEERSDGRTNVRIWHYKPRDVSDWEYRQNTHVWEKAWSQDKRLIENLPSHPTFGADQARQHYRNNAWS